MKIVQYQMTAPNAPFDKVEIESPDLAPGQVLIEVAGCGVCRTDLEFYSGAVPTRHPLPLTLGHEVSGRVVAAGPDLDSGEWTGRAVVVPAVNPCGECELCRRGRGAICRKQTFIGNDIHGGFASHVVTAARGLCPVPGYEPGHDIGKSGVGLAELSVLADAFTTSYQAVVRSGLRQGDLAVVVGTGGVGGFAVQIAAALGARVVAIDVDEEKLERLRGHGAALPLCVKGMEAKAVRQAVRGFAKQEKLAPTEWKIFETSGSTVGQSLAFQLLTHGAHLSIVGYIPESVSVRLSNLMAFDAVAAGNWGCLPERYPEALGMILDGRVSVAPFVETRPLASAAEVLQAMHHGKTVKRVVLVPEGA